MSTRKVPRGLSPGEVAARAGLSVSALHYYEREGLIAAWRTEGNQRRYDRSALRRLGVIKAAQALGVPLAEIKKQLSGLPLDAAPKQRDWARVAKRWGADLDERIAQLTRLRKALDGCIGCGCLSVKSCPLYNPDDELGKRGTGAVYVTGGKRAGKSA